MEEGITQVNPDATQVTEPVNEVNTVDEANVQTTPQENTEDGNVENSNEEQVVNGNEEGQKLEDIKPTNEELMARLKEYEVKEEEEKLLRESLGLQDVDSQAYNYMNIEQQVINQGKQEYLRLCTEFGVDANPDKIDASIEALKQSDPQKGYEFLRRFEQLGAHVQGQRQYVQQQVNNYELSKFSNEYNQLLNASPALNNIVSNYVNNFASKGNIYKQLHNVMDIIMPAYQEAFEAGKRFALDDRAKKDTSAVSGGIATSTTQTYSSGNTFTREQIRKMSPADFAKYEKEIHQQMMEGKII